MIFVAIVLSMSVTSERLLQGVALSLIMFLLHLSDTFLQVFGVLWVLLGSVSETIVLMPIYCNLQFFCIVSRALLHLLLIIITFFVE